ncbi:MAG: nickel pincer cofactor biosynthesis protein LarC [Candidatus Bathyarchaeota archaeon]|nr:nickel pincer cofactor biosynthesis protein LarC [Candidatus Bathyarchaeota archaeon]
MCASQNGVSDRIVFVDCQTAGVAGDMFLGTLIDLGANVESIVSAIKALGNPEGGYGNVEVEIKKVMRRGLTATQIDVKSDVTPKKNGLELVELVEKSAANLGLSAKARQFASRAIRTLVNAEAGIHGNNLADTHLHEVGLVDTPAEILGVAVALEDLGLFNAKIYATPVSVGGGTIKFSHGIVPIPAPATLTILQSNNFPFKGGPIEVELATPTGAAILVNLVDEVSRVYPCMQPLKVGYGAATKDFPELANVLRITIGKPLNEGLLCEEIAVLETNIDDVTGEIVGYTLERLLLEGAKDVSIIPMFTKKSRPGQILKVIADKKDTECLSRVIMEETGTLGVRAIFCERHILNRELHEMEVSINGVKEKVNVKATKDNKGRVFHIKPEYEDLKRVAEATKMPLREVSEIVMTKARDILQKRQPT